MLLLGGHATKQSNDKRELNLEVACVTGMEGNNLKSQTFVARRTLEARFSGDSGFRVAA